MLICFRSLTFNVSGSLFGFAKQNLDRLYFVVCCIEQIWVCLVKVKRKIPKKR